MVTVSLRRHQRASLVTAGCLAGQVNIDVHMVQLRYNAYTSLFKCNRCPYSSTWLTFARNEARSCVQDYTAGCN